ncbi:MAG TPA: FAD-linked oxidase C-terminal domain-containing protein, partial [Candidatus Tumulicola sp.]|nr:FAD-linked oxidase C-terminal domain-containing protein [Candidatus Tumulicola sp.]
PSPAHRALLVVAFEDLAAAGDCVPLCDGYGPIALEGLADSLFHFMEAKGEAAAWRREVFPDGKAWLICEFGGDSSEEACTRAEALQRALGHRVRTKLLDDAAKQREVWAFRDEALGSTSKIPGEPDYYPGWEDSAVDPARLGDYLRAFQAKLDEYGYRGALYGHFGQACVHVSIDFDLFTREGIAKYRRFVTEMAHVCVAHGGSLSGEHGDGQSRGELLPIMYGDELVRAFWEFKTIWDPDNRMNPGKVVRPNPLDADLRWGPDYHQGPIPTYFRFGSDDGSFAAAANRCVGTGKCRKHDSGTMCPSYMATREEAYSTRGRARLLFEMLRGDPMTARWQDEAVKDALDLCLSCKGCKGECPVNVDMATYKAEFLAHYYEGRPRPIAAYAFGWMQRWSALASLAPGAVNAIAQMPVLNGLLKSVAGVAPQRHIPLFAPQTFRSWFRQRTPAGDGRRGDVLLWPDTWNDHFHPSTAAAAVEVLEHAGFRVQIPRAALCCGRPLYDFGMLDDAKRSLRRILAALRPQIESGIPLVGLEPSCVSVFRDELNDLLEPGGDARRLSQQTYLLTEFLNERAPEYVPPALHRKALVQQHCHHKAVLKKDAARALFAKMELECEWPDSGCCGMAGPFGFERRHYDVSMDVGERVLLPRVRAVPDEVLIVADGFSCREQIAQTTHRLALHPAQVLRLAIGGSVPAHLPERACMEDPQAARTRAARNGLAATVAGGAGLLAAAALVRRR